MNGRAATAFRGADGDAATHVPEVSVSDMVAGLVALTAALPGLTGPLMDSSDLGNRDPEFLARVTPLFFAVGQYYFRAEADGLRHVPRDRPFIAVGNHSGAPLLPDSWVGAAWWAMEVGLDRPVYILVHDVPLRIPILGNLMMRAGCLRASRANAEKALASGASVLIYPGGDLECMRSFRARNRIDFRGRMGFAELALRHGVPILPFVNVGGAEVYFTVFQGERLARWAGLDRLARINALPLNVGLPWGLWLGAFFPYLPLPAKFSYRIAPAITVERNQELARDRTAVQGLYRRVTGTMQNMVDDLASRRRFPVIG